MSDDELLLNNEEVETIDTDMGAPRKISRYDQVFNEIGDEQEEGYGSDEDDDFGSENEDEFGGYQAGGDEDESDEDMN